MRIVHVADFISTRLGYQELLLPVWNASHGHEVHVVTSNLNPAAPDYEASFAPLLGPREMALGSSRFRGVTIHRLPAMAEVRTRVFMRGLVSTIASLRPDVVYGHGTLSPTAFLVAHVASKLGIPAFLDNHMVFRAMDTSRVGQATYALSRVLTAKYLAPRVETFYGVASECCDFLIEAQGVPPDQVALLPLGVDTSLFTPKPEEGAARRAEWGVPSDALIIGQTGKLDRSKSPELLAEAASRLMANNKQLHCVFVGAGPDEQMRAISQSFQRLGVHDRLHIVPPVAVTELAEVFSAMDIVVYPGGTSMSSLEAAACRRPVVMNDLPASRWRAELGVGTTFPEGNIDALSSVLAKLSADAHLRQVMGVEARESVLREFSYDEVARQLECDMDQALDDLGLSI